MPNLARDDRRRWAAKITAAHQRTVQAIFETGRLLLQAKAALPHGDFGSMVREELPFGDRTAQMYMRVAADQRLQDAKRVSHLPPAVGTLYEISRLGTDEWDRLLPHLSADLRRRDVKQFAEAIAQVTGRTGLDAEHDLDVLFSSESEEWYTPPHILDAVVAALGGIDLDPCSNPGHPIVPAGEHFTREDDGLSRQWTGRVYMNPPYGRGIGAWTRKLRASYESGSVAAAIALLPARTDTAWMYELRPYLRCYIRGRLAFSESDVSAPFPSCAIYLGPEAERFESAFRDLGDTYGLVSD